MHIFQFHFKTFKAHQLIGNFLAQSANRGIFDISQKMFHSNFFGFLSANFGWNMLKCFGCGRSVIVNLFDCLLYNKKRVFLFSREKNYSKIIFLQDVEKCEENLLFSHILFKKTVFDNERGCLLRSHGRREMSTSQGGRKEI